MHEKHGSGLMKKSQNNKKSKTSAVSTPASVPPSDTPKAITPEPESAQNGSQVLVSAVERSKINDFLREDKFLTHFEDHKIIETYESDGREMYYCCYCDEYFNSFPTLEKHTGEKPHTSVTLLRED